VAAGTCWNFGPLVICGNSIVQAAIEICINMSYICVIINDVLHCSLAVSWSSSQLKQLAHQMLLLS